MAKDEVAELLGDLTFASKDKPNQELLSRFLRLSIQEDDH
jgi:hypothetical protein